MVEEGHCPKEESKVMVDFGYPIGRLPPPTLVSTSL